MIKMKKKEKRDKIVEEAQAVMKEVSDPIACSREETFKDENGEDGETLVCRFPLGADGKCNYNARDRMVCTPKSELFSDGSGSKMMLF